MKLDLKSPMRAAQRLTRIHSAVFVGLLMLALASPANAWINAVYTLNGGSADLTNQTYNATGVNESAIYVLNGGKLVDVDPTITTDGSTTNSDDSSFYGLNAGVLCSTNSTLVINGGSVTTTGTGANGVFATGTGAIITLSHVTVNCSGQLGHGVDATMGGTVNVTNCTIATQQANGSVLATDRGGGYLNVWGGTYSAAGTDSAGVYSTGTIMVNSAHVYSTGGEAVVIEGANAALLTNCTISGVKGTRDRGVFIYQSMSGDSMGYLGALTMVGGSYTWPSTTGPAFYFTNTRGTVYLRDVLITNASGMLIECTTNQWGTAGQNGGTANFTADHETLTGSVISDGYSTNYLTLTNGTTLTGSVTSAQSLTIYTNCIWNTVSNSVVKSTLTNAGTINLTGVLTCPNVLLTAVGTFGGSGTLSGNLTVDAGATLGLNPATNFVVGGKVVFGGAVTVQPSTTNIAAGTYRLLTYSNSLSGSPVFTYVAPTGSGQTAVFNTATSGVVYVTISVAATTPTAPAELTATAGDAQVALQWDAVANAASYYVKYSLVSGGNYTTLANNATTHYASTGLTNGTLLYFVVTATNSAGESANSTEVSARPVSSVTTNLSLVASDSGLSLSWPADHTGWILQTQTNSLETGLGTNWVEVADSTGTNQTTISPDPGNGGVFFRLVHP
jgi:hypothetical protein